jgi:hypothetical protein
MKAATPDGRVLLKCRWTLPPRDVIIEPDTAYAI